VFSHSFQSQSGLEPTATATDHFSNLLIPIS